MTKWRNLAFAAIGITLLAGCTTNPNTGEREASKAGVYGGVGAVAGAVIGAATSSKEDRAKGAAIGAAVGAAAGGGYGYYVDTQEAKLRETLQGTGVDVQRNGDDLRLIMPGNITFATNSSDISSSFYQTLNSMVSVFNEFDQNGIDIVGHTDSTGSMELNQNLSNSRAQSVASYLASNGVAASRISSYGVGPNQPIASNANEAGRAQNRRVEINLRPM
ncbi:OmpA family protein [Nitrincola sp. MINF-07-Sa-05]|uniref:OmpA family protein n=1 Tax=Nitrincola salilacus TaxID=3400273 RepID=UPI003917FB42